jgi:hypothetical protein
MNWSAYEIFTVLSGVALAIGGLMPGGGMKDRLWMVAGGVLLIGYGIYVANQTGGTWMFPIWIFVIPVAAGLWAVGKAVGRMGEASADTKQDPDKRDDGAVI